MMSVLGFLVILGPLVIVHELGHFLFARLFNVRADIFSVGFGPVLWSRKGRETEFRISAIPLGGYVKLFGEEPDKELSPEDQKRALQYQAPWKRFFIFFGGPLFNFLFAILIYMVILSVGEPQLGSYLGRVVPNSEAYRAGLRSGDQILSVSGQKTRKFAEVAQIIFESPNRPLKFLVSREGKTQTLVVTPSSRKGFGVYGEQRQVGELNGAFPFARSTHVGVSNSKSLAARLGIETGDRVTHFNGKPIDSWESLLKSLKQERGKIQLSVIKKGTGKEQTISVPESRGNFTEAGWGLHSSELFIERVVEGSPAEKIGLLPGDRILRIGSHVLKSFYELKEQIQKQTEKNGEVLLAWERQGLVQEKKLIPTAKNSRDAHLKTVTHYTIGIMPMLKLSAPFTVTDRIFNPFVLTYKATERMLDFTWKNAVAIFKIFSGEVSVATLGGPILIGQIAGDSLRRGWLAFLSTMAILSVSLGFLNILPIPVLDGGHLLLLGIEVVRGKPLSFRQIEIVQWIGLTMVLALMAIVLRNDLARLPFLN